MRNTGARWGPRRWRKRALAYGHFGMTLDLGYLCSQIFFLFGLREVTVGDEVIDIGLGLALKLFGDIGLALDADAEDIGQSFRGPDLAGDGFLGVVRVHHGEVPKAVDD